MLVRLLGPVDAVDDDGQVLPVQGARRRAVLAALALRPGELVSVDRIVDAVWDAHPPATARNTVQVHVGYLRRALGLPEALTGRAPGYVLTLPAPATDAVLVESLLAQAAVAATAAERIPLLEQAAAHWRGAPLADVGESSYLARHAHVLDQLRLTTTERLLADHLREGHHQDVVERAARLVVELPDRDRPTQLLMTALYRSGRPVDALAAYEDLEQAQRESFGVEPGAVLRALRDRITHRDPGLHVPATTTPPRVRRPPVEATGALRAPRSRLVGREAELTRLHELLERGRLVTLVGMGGVGKTRLALEVARDGRAGRTVEVVDLTPAGEHPDQVAQVVASALAVQPEDGQDLSDALAAALRGPDRLLLVDNCEHVVDAAARLVDRLLTDAPELTVLATSREPLHLDGEECLLLGPLPVDPHDDAGDRSPAVAMLVDRARAADPAYDPTTADLEALTELCRQVDGLPLALEIIGPRLRSLTATELAEGLASRVLAWADRRRGTSNHRRSLADLMDWSYALLDEAERALLDQLSTLRGGAWLVEAAQLCPGGGRAGEDVLLSLIDRSLLARTEVEGRSRVSMHPLVSAYAAGRLATAGTSGVAGERHAQWVEELARADAEHWHGPGETARLRWRTLDAGNVHAALEWRRAHDPEALSRIVPALWWWWYRSGEGAAGYAWTRTAVDALPASPTPQTARTRLAAAYLAWLVDRYPEARSEAGRALDLAGSDDGVTGFAHGVLSRVCGDEGDFGSAVEHALASITAYERGGDAWGVAWSRRCLAGALRYAGRLEDSDAACRAAVETFRLLGDGWGLAGALTAAASVREAMGDLTGARQTVTEAVVAHRSLGDVSGERRALQQLAGVLWAQGAVGEAGEHARASLALSESHGYLVGALQALLLLEDVARADGDVGRADEDATRAADLATRLGSGADLSLALARRRRDVGVRRA